MNHLKKIMVQIQYTTIQPNGLYLPKYCTVEADLSNK